MTLAAFVDDSTKEDIKLTLMAANPVRTLERAVGHIGKTPNFNTGPAIQILNKMCSQLLKEKRHESVHNG